MDGSLAGELRQAPHQAFYLLQLRISTFSHRRPHSSPRRRPVNISKMIPNAAGSGARRTAVISRLSWPDCHFCARCVDRSLAGELRPAHHQAFYLLQLRTLCPRPYQTADRRLIHSLIDIWMLLYISKSWNNSSMMNTRLREFLQAFFNERGKNGNQARKGG